MLASVLAIPGVGWLTIQTPKRFAQANNEKSCFRSKGSSMQGVDGYTMESGMLTHLSDWDIEKIEI